jgi:hypothetical protein
MLAISAPSRAAQRFGSVERLPGERGGSFGEPRGSLSLKRRSEPVADLDKHLVAGVLA